MATTSQGTELMWFFDFFFRKYRYFKHTALVIVEFNNQSLMMFIFDFITLDNLDNNFYPLASSNHQVKKHTWALK